MKKKEICPRFLNIYTTFILGKRILEGLLKRLRRNLALSKQYFDIMN